MLIAIPHSHTWFWTQTCLASLTRCASDADIVVVDNSPWSPTIRGVELMGARILTNTKSNKFHASALDCVVEMLDFDFLLAMETDVLALKPTWIEWFVSQMRPTDYAVGHWHHEQFVNPSCTLYRGSVLREMAKWCKENAEPNVLRWGLGFLQSQQISDRQPERDYKDWYDEQIDWIAGPFADKRGWPQGTSLREAPSGQTKGPGWYEPGQMLHHWAVEHGYTYTVCPTVTKELHPGLPIETLYGGGQAAHMWGGTRALDIVKHDVTCEFVRSNTPFWLEREARMWRETVPEAVQKATLALIRQYGWHYTGQGNDHVTDRDKAAVAYIREYYARGGVEW